MTYHDAEHLGIAVDTERGLMVPVIRNAGDLNIGGLARKIADLAQRTRAGQVSPDDLTGGTFTLTNTGSRGALFDTPIINQPQVGILGTGTVNKRAVVVDDPDLGEVITVRSIVYLALTYDHRLVDGADAARFLVTVKNRLEEGAFEAELGYGLGDPMRVAISGASGLIGSALAADLSADGAEVVRLVRRAPARPTRSAGTRRPPTASTRPRWRRGCRRAPVRSADRRGALDGARKAELRASRIAVDRRRSPRRSRRPIRPPARCSAGRRSATTAIPATQSSTRVRLAAPASWPSWSGTGKPRPTRPGSPATRVVDLPLRASSWPPSGGMLGRLLLPFRLGLGAKIGSGHAVLQLDQPDRRGPGDQVPARACRRQRPVQPHRARAGHQRRVHQALARALGQAGGLGCRPRR